MANDNLSTFASRMILIIENYRQRVLKDTGALIETDSVFLEVRGGLPGVPFESHL